MKNRLTLRKAMLAGLAGATILIGGCQPYISDALADNLNDPNIPGKVDVRKKIQFPDIPTPEVFVLRRDDTDSFQGSGMRFGMLVYDGIWNTWNTSQWYMDHMKLTEWKLVDTKYPGEYEAVHTYTKGEEKAVIHIYRYQGNTRLEIMLNEDKDERDKIKAMARAGMAKGAMNKYMLPPREKKQPAPELNVAPSTSKSQPDL